MALSPDDIKLLISILKESKAKVRFSPPEEKRKVEHVIKMVEELSAGHIKI